MKALEDFKKFLSDKENHKPLFMYPQDLLELRYLDMKPREDIKIVNKDGIDYYCFEGKEISVESTVLEAKGLVGN